VPAVIVMVVAQAVSLRICVLILVVCISEIASAQSQLCQQNSARGRDIPTSELSVTAH